jgi:hypothetical protein
MTSYIITTGDVSDFDGFLSLALYKKAATVAIAKGNATQVVFIMNYPAYMNIPPKMSRKSVISSKINDGETQYTHTQNEIQLNSIKKQYDQYIKTCKTIEKGEETDKAKTENKNKIDIIDLQAYGRAEPGKGYVYSAEELFKIQPIDTHYNSFFTKISGIVQFSNTYYKECMKQLAFEMCKRIWESLPGSVDLIFVDGGINTINPFSIDVIKNEFNVYLPILLSKPNVGFIENDQFSWSSGPPVPLKKPSVYIHTMTDCINNITSNINNTVYMDMNGSMAFYNNAFKIIIPYMKSFVIMGGVVSDKIVNTLSTTAFLNRFSSSTMNQLYSPQTTTNFINDLNTFNFKAIHVVSNNLINLLFTYLVKTNEQDDRTKSFDAYITCMKRLKLLPHGIVTDLYTQFYTFKTPNREYLVPPAFKPFDVLSSFILVRKFLEGLGLGLGDNVIDQTSKLVLSTTYGTAVVSSNATMHSNEIINEFIDGGLKMKHLQAQKFIMFAVPGLESEIHYLQHLPVGDLVSIAVQNVWFGSNSEIELAIKTFMNPAAGGGIKKLKRTDERFGKLVVYVGPRGGKYIKKKGEYISLRTLVNKKKK